MKLFRARLLPIPALLRRGFAGAASLLPGLVLANPTGGQVVSGQVNISTPSSNGMVVTEGTNSAIVNWQSFSIGGNEYVQFVQPSSSSVILNRVIGNSPSSIFGNLSANGRVFLINPDGVLFAPGSSVDVGALVASTVDINNSDFLAGRYVFSGGRSGIGITNNGTITAQDGGFIVLNGDYVHNTGVIQARLGEVVLASGSAMTLSMDQNNLIGYTVNQAALSQQAGVSNSGQLLADGGHIIMTAEVAHNLVSTAVNNTGLVRAQGISQNGGEIELTASGGDIVDSGTLDASSTLGNGGNIELNSDQNIDLESGGKILASGTALGGGIQLVADGELWTREDSLIDAHALNQGGIGGYLELSGHGKTLIRGDMDLGRGGTLTIDPTNLTIASGSGSTSSGTLNATWYQQNIANFLKGGTNVNLVATNSITMNSLGGSTHTLDGTNNGAGGSLLLGIGTLTGGGPTTGGTYVPSAGGTIGFQTLTDSIKVDGNLTINAGSTSGVIDVGNLTAGTIALTGKTSVTTGALSASLGNVTINGGNITTGAITVDNTLQADSSLNINSTGNVIVNGTITVAGGGGSGTSGHPNVMAGASINATGTVAVTGDISVTGHSFNRSFSSTSFTSKNTEGDAQLQVQGSSVSLTGVSVTGVGNASFGAHASNLISIGSDVNVTASRATYQRIRTGGSSSIDDGGLASVKLGAINSSATSALTITTHGLSATGPNASVSVSGGTLNLNNGASGIALNAVAHSAGTPNGTTGAYYQHSYGGGSSQKIATNFGAAAVSVNRVSNGNTNIGTISVSGPTALLRLQGSGGVTTVTGNISVQASGYTINGSASAFPAFRRFGSPAIGISSATFLEPPTLLNGTTKWGAAKFIAGFSGSSVGFGDPLAVTGNVTVSGLGQADVTINGAGLTIGGAVSVTANKGSLQGVSISHYFNSTTQTSGSISRTVSNSAGTGAATFGQGNVTVNIGNGTNDITIGSLSVRGLSAQTSLQGGRNVSITGGVTVDGQFGGSAPDYKEVTTVNPGASSTGTTVWVGDNNFLKIGGITPATGAVSLGDVSLSGYGLVNLLIEGNSISMGNVSVTQSTGLFTSTDKTRYSTSYSLTNPGTSIELVSTAGPVQANSLTVTSAGALAQNVSLNLTNAYSITAPSYTTVVSGLISLPNPLLNPGPNAPGNAQPVPADGSFQGGVTINATDISLNISGNLALTSQSLSASHNLSIQTGGNLTLSSNTLAGANSLSLKAGGNFSDTNSTLASRAITIKSTGSLNLSGTSADGSSTLNLAATGPLSASNASLIGNTITISGNTGVTLTNSTIAGAGSTAATSITMTSSNGTITGAGSTVVQGGTVNMTGLGFVSNATTLTPRIVATDLTLDATGGDLDVTPAVTLNVTHDMLLESQTGSVKVSENLAAGNNVTIQASNGLVTTQAISAGGAVAITAGNSTIGSVTTGNISGASSINLHASTALTTGSDSATGNIALTAGTGNLTTQSLTAGGGVTLTAASGSVTTQALAAGGPVSVTAGTAISTGNITGASSINLGAGTTLTTGNNGATGNITLTGGTGITLTNDALAAGGTLSLTATTGDINATNASLSGSSIALTASTGAIALNNSLLSAGSIAASAATDLGITHSSLGGTVGGNGTTPATLIALSATTGNLTLDNATALTGDAVGLYAGGSVTSTNTSGATLINAGALSVQALNTIDLSTATLAIGDGNAQFGSDSTLLQQISTQSGGNILLPSSGPNASFKAQVVNLGAIQTQTAGSDLYLYIESQATTSGLGYSIASLSGAGNSLLDYNLYSGSTRVVNPQASITPHPMVSQATTPPVPLTIDGAVNAPAGLTTLVIGTSLYGGNITVNPDAAFTPNDPASVNLVLATTGTITGASNLHTTGYVLLLNQIATTPVLPITPGDYSPPPSGELGSPQPAPDDPDDPGVNDANKGTITQQTSSQGALTSCGGT